MRLVVSSIVVVVGLLLGQPTEARAQLVDTSDPCFEVLFPKDGPLGKEFRDVLANGSRDNRQQVELAASALGSFLDYSRGDLKVRLDLLEMGGKPPSNEELARWRRWYGCLPWLKRQVALLESDLKRLGISTIQMPEDRHKVQREQLIRDAIDDLEAIERLLGPVVKRR